MNLQGKHYCKSTRLPYTLLETQKSWTQKFGHTCGNDFFVDIRSGKQLIEPLQ